MHPSIRALLVGGVLSLAIAVVLSIVLSERLNQRPANVHVRWAPSVDEATRERLELAHGLRRGEARPFRTWSYLISDLSPAALQRLVEEPAVEDTNFIDRQAFRIQPTAGRAFRTARDARAARNFTLAIRIALFAGVAALLLALGRMTGAWPAGPGAGDTGLDSGATPRGAPRVDVVFVAILVMALIPRLYLATTAEYIHDEENTAIPLARSISFASGAMHLPLRGENHGALPAYIVKASSALFGATPLGYRALHLLLGLCTIALLYQLTRSYYGVTAARWAAAIMAFNEYFLSFSSRATANTPFLFLEAAAIFAFARFLASERPRYLFMGATATGLAFYCKEHAVLLLPVALAALLWPHYRPWWRRRALYVAASVFALLIAPDVIWNLRTDPTTANVTYRGEYLGQATYSAHLRRIGGLGLSPYPAMFYAREPVSRLYRFATGEALVEPARDYRSVNPAIGLFLIAATLWMTASAHGHAPVRRWLLSVAWTIFIFFTFIRPGNTPYRLTPVSWVWVEVTLLPAVVCAGALLARVQGGRQTLLWLFASTALMYAVAALTWPLAF